MKHPTKKSGFALLMSLIVVSVVVSVALAVVDLTIKQLRLATSSKDSEIAFHAANAGMECMRYQRLTQSGAFELGTSPINTSCFGQASSSNAVPLMVVGTGNAFKYTFDYTWSGSTVPDRCTEATVVTINSDFSSITTLNNVAIHVPGYPSATSVKECSVGGRCTIISVQGYNRPCVQKNAIGTIQREVLLEL